MCPGPLLPRPVAPVTGYLYNTRRFRPLLVWSCLTFAARLEKKEWVVQTPGSAGAESQCLTLEEYLAGGVKHVSR